MTLKAGTRLGPYEVLSAAGAGGMGEVYKAKDTRLDRLVAIKVLPSHLASDPDAKERFEREARAVSSLNHPHICTLHDIGEQDGTGFLVMEYLEGESLADRLNKGALPLNEALRYAVQIADALDKAHRQGVVHRDLKPGNIMLTKSGAKLLDFGLAKLSASPGETSEASALSALPTEQRPLTEQGAILGTFQYMAPEQLEGKTADARTDLFAFGAVLYEMVTGQRAFSGKSQASLIAAIMEHEPQAISALRTMTPPLLDHIVGTCLAKDPEARWQSAGDLARELTWIGSSTTDAKTVAPLADGPRAVRYERLVWALIVLAGLGYIWTLRPPDPLVTRLALRVPGVAQPGTLAVSPDGRLVVFPANSQLYVRSMDREEATPIRGTEDGSSPFLSPDGRWLGFFADGSLKKVSLDGAAPITLADAPVPRGGSWGADETIVFAPAYNGGLWRVNAFGGPAEALTEPDAAGGELSHRLPDILPGGRAALVTVERAGSFDDAFIAAFDLATGDMKKLVDGGSQGRYVPTGHLLYVRGGSLYALPFNADRLEVSGSPIQLVEQVGYAATGGFAAVGVSALSGTLVYAPYLGASRALVWVDREGNEEEVIPELSSFEEVSVSPDGLRLAVIVRGDAWTLESSGGALSRATFKPWIQWSPLWSPDGQWLTFGSSESGAFEVYRVRFGANAPEKLLASELDDMPSSWSPDGQELLFDRHAPTSWDVWKLTLHGDEAEAFPVLQTDFDERQASFSHDGRWIAYVSNESGHEEVYVQSSSLAGRKWRISAEGGQQPRWSPNGRELIYRNGDQIMTVAVTTQPQFDAKTPKRLLEGAYINNNRNAAVALRDYDVSSDGERLVMIKPSEAELRNEAQLIVVLNWFQELERLVPVDR